MTSTAKQEPVRTMMLPVGLSKDERDVRGRELASVVGEQTELETELARAEGTWKGSKKRLEGEIETKAVKARNLSRVVKTGQEDRDVVVETAQDFEDKRVDTVRTDTGEVVQSRPMTVEETQRPLPLDAKRSGGKGAQA